MERAGVHNSLQFEAALGGGGVMLRQKGNELLQQAQDMRHVEVQFLMGFCMCRIQISLALIKRIPSLPTPFFLASRVLRRCSRLQPKWSS
ncbi:hypothetical protein quinque_010249 [Culex quinquefasciatus]